MSDAVLDQCVTLEDARRVVRMLRAENLALASALDHAQAEWAKCRKSESALAVEVETLRMQQQ